MKRANMAIVFIGSLMLLSGCISSGSKNPASEEMSPPSGCNR
ncbi:hypothetical protein ACFQI7_15570 [Paenibacillus allorhizosphaerae]|nr:hypothetical protein [Paenibacillus allorhizosphaerae]